MNHFFLQTLKVSEGQPARKRRPPRARVAIRPDTLFHTKPTIIMYWTLELATYLEDAPFPATRDELMDFAYRTGAPLEVIENLQEMEDEGELYEGIEDIWPDYPRKDDFLFNEDEY